MQPALRLLLALIVAAAVVGGGYYWWQRQQAAPQAPAAPSAAVPPSSNAPAVQHPIEEACAESKEIALPALIESDSAVKSALATAFP